MLPDPLFWYGLALKVTLTATIVVVASVAAERSGPFIAALIAALPTAAARPTSSWRWNTRLPSLPPVPSAAWPRMPRLRSSRSATLRLHSATASSSA